MADERKNRAAVIDRKIDCWVCACPEPLATAEDHHRSPRAFGGTDQEANRVWLCPSCHARLHRVQGLLMQGKVASGIQLSREIFPTNGTARGNLWTLANEAAQAEREAKEVFGLHKTHQKVTLSVEIGAWNALKAEAKSRKTSASKLAASILEKTVREYL
jgi:hypothetical protein